MISTENINSLSYFCYCFTWRNLVFSVNKNNSNFSPASGILRKLGAQKKKSVYVASGLWWMVFLQCQASWESLAPKKRSLFMLLVAPGRWFFLTGSHPAGNKKFFYLDIFPNFNNVLLSASYYFYGRFIHCSSNYAFHSFLSQFVF